MTHVIKPSERLRPSPVDGQSYTDTQEQEINGILLAAFNTASGKKALHYLRRITVNVALGPNATDCALRHMEGQRYLVGIIETRIKLAQQAREKKDKS